MTGRPEARREPDGGGSRTRPWTVLRLMLWSADYLATKGVESARLDAEHLLAHVLGVGRLEMYLQHERLLDPAELDRFRPLLKRRAAREPLQYILGRHPFRELDLEIGPEVLIPRPETEVLVGEVLEWAEARASEGLLGLDVGTGSGAIALSLLAEGPFARVVATDTSGAALELARRNGEASGMDGRLELRSGPLFEPILPGESFDVVVSNPPYVSESERADMAPEVVDWEPHGALFAGPDGLAVLRGLVGGAKSVLRPGGLLAVEVGAGQAERVGELLEESGEYHDVRRLKDLTGKERIVTAERSAGNQS